MAKEDLNKKLVKIAKEAVEPLKKLKSVKFILIEGAVSEGTADKYSDIDMPVLCSNIPKFEVVKKVLLNITKEIKFYGGTISSYQIKFLYKNIEISLIFMRDRTPKRELKRILKNPENPGPFLFSKHHLYWALNTIILYESYGFLREFRKKVKFRENLKRGIIKKTYADIRWNFLKEKPGVEVALKRGNFIGASNMANLSIERFIDIIYTLNNKLYFYPKWAFKVIPKLKIKPRRCAEQLQQIAKLGNNKKEIEQKIKLFRALMKDTEPLIRKYLK